MSKTFVPPVVPILSAGRHRSPRQGACFMEFASYLAGERWSDHPSCTHPVLAALARDVNDLSSDAARAELTPLIHRVVGLTSDDPRVMARISVLAATAALPIASMDRQRGLAAALLNIMDKFDDAEFRQLATEAFAQSPDAERWARSYLARTPVPRVFDRQAALAVVHTAALGIALACVPDQDARLGDLLRTTIADLEHEVRPAAQPQLVATH